MMNISEILAPERVCLHLEAGSRKKVLEQLATLMGEADTALDQRGIFDRLFAREKLGSTGLGHGVALPHGRIPGMDHALAAVVTLEEGLADFDPPDGQAVDLVFGLVVPEECTEDHLQILAQVARLLSDEAVRERLRGAASGAEVCALLGHTSEAA